MTLPALKPARGSQCARVLAVLQDGRPHTVPEIHDRAGTMRLNSRIAELRKRGHNIICEHTPGETGAGAYSYRLITGPLSPGRPEATAESEATPYGLAAARDGEQTDGVQPPSPRPGLSDPSSFAGGGPSGSGLGTGTVSSSRPDNPGGDAHAHGAVGLSPAEEEEYDMDARCVCGHRAYMHTKQAGDPGDCLATHAGRFTCECETFRLAREAI